MNNTIKKLLIILLLTIQVGVQLAPVVYAEESVEETSTESTSTEQQTPPPADEPEQPAAQEQVVVSTPAPTPYVEDETDKAARLYREQLQREIQDQVDAYLRSQGITPPERNRVSPTPAPQNALLNAATSTNDSTAPTGVGDVEIETGDATNATHVVNSGNNNSAATGVAGGGGDGAVVANTGNGTNSTNDGSAVVNNDSTTTQTNSATVNTDLDSSTVTGDNTASNNVGNSSIETGDANTTGTVLTMVNTNAAGVMVAEFNVMDDQVGDVVLDFAANCVLGCSGPTQVSNTGNGSNSNNGGSVDTTNNTTTNQENDAQIGNDLTLIADSGNNTASRNTGGDSNITTGDANVAANVMTFANNNIAGNVIFGIVNIFGDLIGDIIFPEDQLNACCGGQIAAANTGNGSNSTNSSNVEIIDTQDTFQSNTADITNNLTFDANTGENDTSGNTSGDSTVNTGDTSVDVNVLNIANTNLIGGNWWIVLVNDVARGWIGKIMGMPDGSFFAGSEGSDFEVDENGFITVKNNKNGSNSTNDASVSNTSNNTTNQTNNADIVNNLNLSANTGNNESSDNTGGDSKIKTGDATIVANMINFVNNNIVGNGKVFVTVVNVFGTWLGDFVSPGQKKEQNNRLAQSSDTNNDSQENGGSNDNSNKNSNPVTNQSNSSTTGNTNNDSTIATNGGGENTISTNGSGVLGAGVTIVKGLGSENDFLAQGKDIVKVNLAWLLVMVPVLLLIFAGRKLHRRKVSA